MRRGRLIFGAAAALVAASAALLGRRARRRALRPAGADAPQQRGANPAGQLLQGLSPGDTKEQVARLEQRVRREPARCRRSLSPRPRLSAAGP